MHLIEQFFYELRKEKMRMFLTIIAICWGSANVVLMLSVGEGLHRQLSAGMTAWGDRMLVTWGGNTKKAYGGFPSGRWIPLKEEDISMILQQVPEIEAISAEYRRGGSISSDERDYNANLAGVYPCYGGIRNIFPETGGRFINDLDQRNKRRVIVLGNAVRDNLFPNGGRDRQDHPLRKHPVHGDRDDEREAPDRLLQRQRRGPGVHPGLDLPRALGR